MTKRNKPVPKENHISPGNWINWAAIKFLAAILKEVGLTGFIVVILVFIFLFYGTEEQKHEFIDLYFLLKNVQLNPFPYVLVVVFLGLTIVIGNIYYSFRTRMLKDEIKRIATEKTELQKLLLNRELPSSEPEEKLILEQKEKLKTKK